MTKKTNKPMIETIINQIALALTSFGIVQITLKDYYGFICILISVILEWFKYHGRHKKLW
jgi:hypothetical protein